MRSDPHVTEPLMAHGPPPREEEEPKCSSCTPSWVKTFLLFFTAIILMIALALVGLGIYLLMVRLSFLPKLVGEVAYMSHFLLFVVGGLLVIACILGFVAASKRDSCLLVSFALLLSFILLLQLTTGILAFCFSSIFYDWLAGRLASTMQHSYNNGVSGVDSVVDQLQQKFKCCGSRSYKDWKDSVFQNNSKDESPALGYNTVVPDSCCIRVSKACGNLPHPSNIYHQGCMESVSVRLKEHYYVICVVALTLIFVELAGVFLAWCYSKASKQFSPKRH